MSDRVLIVESEAVARNELVRILNDDSREVIAVASCDQSLQELEVASFDLIITELPQCKSSSFNSPESSSPSSDAGTAAIRWVEKLREVAPRVPIILITREGAEPVAGEALMRGAATYIPLHLAAEGLVDTVEQVLKVSRSASQATDIDQCVSRIKLELVLPSHEQLVPAVIARLEQELAQLHLFDEMTWTQIAMALDEAILNAMIHGNLEVESALREVDNGEAYQEKIRRHRELPPFDERRTYVTLTATRSQAVFVIRDQGPGYDVSALPDPTDPANLESIGGRGLLLISAFMDEIHHNEVGNELTMIKRKRSDSSAS
ncbi:response regulator receiver protein [Rhodopirellula islandica]|uniref:Response regulator receiver protein n=1 Tax=Rhodopirellula islandica TaxID=595434 RepID=A0A0J1B3W3_RHOIS|nr:ATP-binding protein [Rhodopirellula islandica]KLU01530.1 response regulator receiver protein [Rhodopirellula islandica]